MATPEKKVKDKIKRVLVTHGVWYYMPVSSGFGAHGIPDFLCCVSGKLLAVEAKAGTNKPTGLQEAQMLKMRAAGATTLVVNEGNIEELETWIKSNKQ